MKCNGTYLLSTYENSGGAPIALVDMRLCTLALSLPGNPHAVDQNCGPAPISTAHSIKPVRTEALVYGRSSGRSMTRVPPSRVALSSRQSPPTNP